MFTFHTADRAFTLFNGLTFRSGHKLHLKISQQQQQQEPQSQILQIRNLPRHIDNNSALYDLFRPFGPMILCKILVEQDSTFKGSALVQYFGSEDAQNAIMKMVCILVSYSAGLLIIIRTANLYNIISCKHMYILCVCFCVLNIRFIDPCTLLDETMKML